MKMHIVISVTERPASGQRVDALCGGNVLVDRPAVGTVMWSDGRVCNGCVSARDSEAYRKARKTFIVIEEHAVREDFVSP